jgi:hypothetical protein
VTPVNFVLLRHGSTPRTITIKSGGYKTVEKRVVPDGKDIQIVLELAHEE